MVRQELGISKYFAVASKNFRTCGKEIHTVRKGSSLFSCRPDPGSIASALHASNKDEEELKKLMLKFAPDTAWRFTKARLVTNEKPQYINTSCRIATDLRVSTVTALLQRSRFPKAPTPTTSIADILKLKEQQRFDLMVVPTAVLNKRNSGASLVVVDVRLADGSVDREQTDAVSSRT